MDELEEKEKEKEKEKRRGGRFKDNHFDLTTTPALRATPPVPGACPSNAMGPHLESEIVKKGHGKDIPRMDP